MTISKKSKGSISLLGKMHLIFCKACNCHFSETKKCHFLKIEIY